MDLKENPTGDDMTKAVNEIKKDIESGEIYQRSQYVGFIKIKDKEFKVTVGIESPNGLDFFY